MKSYDSIYTRDYKMCCGDPEDHGVDDGSLRAWGSTPVGSSRPFLDFFTNEHSMDTHWKGASFRVYGMFVKDEVGNTRTWADYVIIMTPNMDMGVLKDQAKHYEKK